MPSFPEAKNLLILYDAVGTLADSVGAALGAPRRSGQLGHQGHGFLEERHEKNDRC